MRLLLEIMATDWQASLPLLFGHLAGGSLAHATAISSVVPAMIVGQRWNSCSVMGEPLHPWQLDLCVYLAHLHLALLSS